MTADKPAIEFVNEAPPISDSGAHNKDVVFVNDWEPLEKAAALLKENADDQGSYYAHPWVQSSEAEWVFSVLVEYVPRLLTQYASLLETSYALTEGWEAYVKANPPKKLYLPDHR